VADAVFFDILPRFDWAASEAGTKKLVGQFDSAAKQISRTFGVEAGNAATQATEKIAADMRAMQDAVARTTTSATDDYRRMILAQGELEASTLKVVEAVEKGTAESSRYAAALARQEAAIVKADQANATYAASTKAQTDAVAAATAAQATHAAALDASTSKTAAFGAAAGLAGKVGLGIFTVAAYEANKQAMEFQSTQQRLIASAGESRQGLQTVSDGILKMAGDVGYSADQISEAAYNVEKMGFRGRDALQVLGSGAQLARAENADLADTIKGLTITMHDFNTPVEQAADVASKLNVAAGASSGTLQEFSESLHSVEPLAASLHIRMEDLFATMAMASKSGASLDQVTENTRNALNSLSNAQGPARDAMAQLGINAQDVSAKLGERGLAGTMQYLADTAKAKLDPNNLIPVGEFRENAQAAQDAADMMKAMSPAAQQVAQDFANGAISRKDFTGAIKASNATDAAQLAQFGALELKLDGFSSRFKNGQAIVETYNQALKDMTGTVAGQSIALQVTDGHAKDTNDLIAKLSATTRETDETVKGFDETLETQKMQWDKSKAAMGAAAIELGNNLLPTMTTAGQTVAAVTKFLAEHKAVLDTLIGTVGVLGAAWVTTKAAMAIGGLVSTLGTGFATIGGFVTGLAGKYDALAVSASAAADAEAAAAGAGGAFGKGAAAGTAARGLAGAASAATGVGLLAIGTTTASDAFNQWSDSHPEVQRRDAGGNLIHGREAGNGPHPADAVRPPPDPALFGGDSSRGGRARPLNDSARAAAARSAQAQGAIDSSAAVSAAAAARPDITDPNAVLAPQDSGGGGGGAKPPKGDKNDPIYMAPSPQLTAAFPGATKPPGTGTGGQPGTGETGTSILSGGFEFTPAGIGKFTTALLANLALGNPIGKALAEKGSQTNPLYVSDVNSAGGYSTEAQLRAALADIRTQKANDKYQTDLAKYGANDPRTQNAYANLFSAQAAQQTMALRGGFAGGGGGGAAGIPGPAGPGAEGWRDTVGAVVDKYGAQMGIPASQRDNWVDAIVKQIGIESGGNPRADNPNDSDGRGGRQHVAGLLQYLPGSYAASGGRLTGITDMMDPVGQIAGALFAPRNAAGGPASLGRGGGWGPNFNTPILPVPAGGGGAAAGGDGGGLFGGGAVGTDGAMLPDLSQILGGGGGMGGKGGFGGFGDSPIITGPGPVPQPGPGPLFGGGAGGRPPVWRPAAYGNQLVGGGAAGLPGAAGPGALVGSRANTGAGAAAGPAAAAAAQQAPARPSSVPTTQQYGAGQATGSGLSASVGSTLASIAGPAMDAFAPGSSIAAQKGGQLIDRTIGYLGQLGGIAVSAPLESLLPSGAGDLLANPSKSWLGKLALGVAGAHPSGDGSGNRAGASAPPVPDAQKDDASNQAKASAPAAQIPDQAHQGSGAQPGPGGGNAPLVGEMNITTTNGVDGAAIGRDMARYQGGAKR